MTENRRKGGRPAKPAAEKQSLTVRFRTTPAQMKELQGRVKQCNMTLSEYARQMITTGKVVAPVSPEELRLVAELTRERNNLNQIARIANATGNLYPLAARLSEILAFYEETIRKIKQRQRIDK